MAAMYHWLHISCITVDMEQYGLPGLVAIVLIAKLEQ